MADMDALRRYDATAIADAMERHLGDRPAQPTKGRIKRLRGIDNPDYRLSAGDYRVFYNVDEEQRRVDVLRVMHKDQTRAYYEELEP